MKPSGRITLIDVDAHRRAGISRFLMGMGFHVEPFEHDSELEGHWPADGYILVHDSQGSVGQIAGRLPGTGIWLPIIAYSDLVVSDRVVDAILEGAIDYWLLPFEKEKVAKELERARRRTDSFGRSRLREAAARNRVKCLSDRERQVLSGLAAGLQNREIGERLGISPRTVEIHRAHMMQKLRVKNTTEAIRIAVYTSLSLEGLH